MGWKVADELMQIRGGRGYETAESLKARGEKPVPVEQALRDMRINRIFEGSTEIMHLLIAREAVDQHLAVAGDILEPDGGARATKAKAGVQAGAVLRASGCPQLAVGEGQKPGSFDEFGELAAHLRYVERALAQARALDLLRRWAAGRPSWSSKQAFLGRIVDIGAELFAIASAVRLRADDPPEEHPERGDEARRARRPVLHAGAPARRTPCSRDLWANDDDDELRARRERARGPLHVDRGGHRSTRRATAR